MNMPFNFQADEFLKAAREARIPENVQMFAEESVAKSRDAYAKFSAVAKDGAKATEDVVLAATSAAKSLGEKAIQNAAANTEAAFEAAAAVARAKSLPEAVRLQVEFARKQLEVASYQTKEFLELSAKVARSTLETMNAAATKAFEQAKKVD
ncbi:MAG: phasin family protein [Hyphomicrobiaceae bacterium]|jgi:phasin